MTGSWLGPDACAYHDCFCAPSPQEPDLTVVASIDLNYADLGVRTTVEFLQTEGHLPHLSAPYLLAELAATPQRQLSYHHHHHHHEMRQRLHQSLLHHEKRPRWSWLLL
ncbi:pollen-specific leucine-rich repeat extensin-like protein 3 [Miscanthus floridulus]|uniref:pollen-specific leucine-rich repeat extensin-like protein 3 n=1 Tax=Miscanthus floridulus TaxID=154761 RepID=UPI003459B34C